MENLEESLIEAGLTGTEATLYLQLLQLKEISAYDLSKKVGMDRTLTYQVLNNLANKGLVSFIKKNNKKYFKASSPQNLINPINTKKILVEDLIEKLKKFTVKENIINEVNVYEGKQGIRNLLNELYSSKLVYSFGATGKAYDLFYESKRLAKKYDKVEGDRRIILSSKYKTHLVSNLNSVIFKYLDIESEATTTITEEKVFIHYAGENPIVIEINNMFITNSYKEHFKILWSVAKAI